MALRGQDGLALVTPAIVAAAESAFIVIDKLDREKPIESVDMIWHMGQLTIANANEEISSPHEGTEISFAYENVKLSLLGHQYAGYQNYWYPDNELRTGSLTYQDNAAAALTGSTDCYARFKLNCPPAAGKWLTITFRFLGQTYVSEVIANTAWAAGVIYFNPRFGEFNKTIAVNYMMQDGVAAETPFVPSIEGDELAAAIFLPVCNRDGLTADTGALCLNNYPAQNMETDWLTSLKIDVGADRIWEITTLACEQFRTGYFGRVSSAYGAPVATALGHLVTYIPLADYIVPIEYQSSGTVSYKVNCNTCDLMILSIWTSAGPAQFEKSPANISGATAKGAGEVSSQGLTPNLAARSSQGGSYGGPQMNQKGAGPITFRRV